MITCHIDVYNVTYWMIYHQTLKKIQQLRNLIQLLLIEVSGLSIFLGKLLELVIQSHKMGFSLLTNVSQPRCENQ